MTLSKGHLPPNSVMTHRLGTAELEADSLPPGAISLLLHLGRMRTGFHWNFSPSLRVLYGSHDSQDNKLILGKGIIMHSDLLLAASGCLAHWDVGNKACGQRELL